MTETYYLISSWLENWKRKFGLSEKDSLRNLLFEKSFINIARAATVALENLYLTKPENKIQKNQKNSWGRDLLEYLENYYKNKSLVIELLKAEHKKDIENLGKELKKGAYDIKVIYPILQRIKNGLSNQTIGVEFIKELKLNDKADTDKLAYLADALVQNNLFNHGLNGLKDLPQKSVARHSAELFLKNHIGTLANDKKLGIQLWSGYVKFLSDEIDDGKLDEVFNPKSDSIFNLINSYYWENLMRRFLKQLTDVFINEIGSLKTRGNNIAVAEKLEKNKTLHKKIGVIALRLYIPLLIKAVLNLITSRPARDEDSNLSKNLLTLGDWLNTNADFADNQSQPYSHRPDIVDLVITESFASSADDFFGEFLFDKTSIESETKISTDIGRRICAWFAKDVRESEVDWNTISSKTLETFCTTWSARTVFHRNLGLIFSATNDFVIRKLPDIINMSDSYSLLGKKSARQKFWQEWFKKFISYVGFNSHVYKYFPWNKITESDLEQLFTSVFDDFVENKEGWTAIYIVDRLDSKNRIWNIADITFFDPNSFDFGEQRWFPSNIAETVTFAKIDIQANSSKDAALQGWLRLNNVLNESAFVLSLTRSYGGFETNIHPDIFVVQLRTNSWSAGWSLARNDRPIQQSPNAFESFVIPVMDKLFEKEKSNLPLTTLESKFITALHWYNKGRWKRDAAESYIFYWIGIETLFGESGQEKLFPSMSKLAINWRNAYSYELYFLKRHWIDLVKMINEDLKVKKIIDSNSQLKSWEENCGILFNHKNAELLHSLIPKSKKKIKDYAQSYREHLQPLVDDESYYLEKVEAMRSDFRFKLLLLKDLRNRMTHQGIYYHPEMIFYTDELQDIFENFLNKYANVAINQPPPISQLEDLVVEFDKLWVK